MTAKRGLAGILHTDISDHVPVFYIDHTFSIKEKPGLSRIAIRHGNQVNLEKGQIVLPHSKVKSPADEIICRECRNKLDKLLLKEITMINVYKQSM